MIKTQNLTPEIYYKQSRDFQFFGRVYDIIFNYCKTNADLMENFPINPFTDSKLIDLLARTLGFYTKSNYRNDDLNAICNTFISLIKDKGSLRAIDRLVRIILNVEGIKRSYYVGEPEMIMDPQTHTPKLKLPLTIPINIPDVVTNPEIKLLEDVLDYILPIGVCYNITATQIFNEEVGEIDVQTYLQAGNLIDANNRYSNIDVAKNTNKMETTGESSYSEPIGTLENPIIGDFRYTQVVKRQTSVTSEEPSNNEEEGE